MRVRRHFESLDDFKVTPKVWKWLGIGIGMVLAGYLTAYLILFPAPIPASTMCCASAPTGCVG